MTLLTDSKLLHTIIESSPDGIITMDARGAIELFNPTSEQLFRYSEGEVIGKNIKMLMPELYLSVVRVFGTKGGLS